MKRSRKSNRVSWAPTPYLCQVKLFLSEDCPSEVGLIFQDHLQAKTSPILPSSSNEYNDLPPGFEGNNFLNQPKVELAHISPIKWKCPPQFTFSHHWHLAAGEESKEKADQKLREMKVLEAVYPRISAIPPSPAVSFDAASEDYDDNLTPLIPPNPIEEEELMDINPEMEATELADAPTNLQSQNLPPHISATSPIGSQVNSSSAIPLSGQQPLPGIPPAAEPDLVAASALVAAALVKSNEQGNAIDMDLLVKIFNDPKMIEKLAKQHVAAAATLTASSNTAGIPTVFKTVALSVPLSTATSSVGLVPAHAPKQAIPSVSTMMPTPNKPVAPSVPLYMPLSAKSATPSVTLPISPTTPSPPPPSHMHKPTSKNIHPPQHDTVLSSGVKRVAPFPPVLSGELRAAPFPSVPSVPSGELSAVPFSACVNFHAGANLAMQSAATTLPNQPNITTAASAFAAKDANYYKNLIRQHGADKQDLQDSLIGIHRHNNFQDLKPVLNNNDNNIKQREVIYKNQKPCIYFKSPRGCRNGANCPYQHDMPNQWGAGNVLVAQNGKRMKLGPEIKGRS